MVLLSGCWAAVGSTYKSEGSRGDYTSLHPELQEVVPAVGRLPVGVVLLYLAKRGVALGQPPIEAIPNDTIDTSSGSVTVSDCIRQIELAFNWVYEPSTKRFYRAWATHSVDSPDAFGRPAVEGSRAPLERRPLLSVGFRFRRLDLGLVSHPSGASAGINLTELAATIPDGVRGEWDSVEERGYFNGITGAGNVQTTVATTRQTVDAGVQFSALAARLPGSCFRIDGALVISTFVGSGLDRSTLTVPLQLDGPRGEWVRAFIVRGGEGSASAALRGLGFQLSASASAVELSVKVD